MPLKPYSSVALRLPSALGPVGGQQAGRALSLSVSCRRPYPSPCGNTRDGMSSRCLRCPRQAWNHCRKRLYIYLCDHPIPPHNSPCRLPQGKHGGRPHWRSGEQTHRRCHHQVWWNQSPYPGRTSSPLRSAWSLAENKERPVDTWTKMAVNFSTFQLFQLFNISTFQHFNFSTFHLFNVSICQLCMFSTVQLFNFSTV